MDLIWNFKETKILNVDFINYEKYKKVFSENSKGLLGKANSKNLVEVKL
jgi:hypothetical protein